MRGKENTNEQNTGGTKKAGVFERMMGRMMARMMTLCPCSAMMKEMADKQGAGCGCAETLAQAKDDHGEGGFCAAMMAACCGAKEESTEEAHRA